MNLEIWCRGRFRRGIRGGRGLRSLLIISFLPGISRIGDWWIGGGVGGEVGRVGVG